MESAARAPVGRRGPEEPEGGDASLDDAVSGLPGDGTILWSPPPPSPEPARPREVKKPVAARPPVPSRPPVPEADTPEGRPTMMWPAPSQGSSPQPPQTSSPSRPEAKTLFMEVGALGEVTPRLTPQEAIVEYLRETDAYLRYGIYEKALEYAAKVLAEDPENDEAHEKARTALLASKGSAAAFDQLLKVLRLYADRLDAERAGPFLDELLAQRPSHPELPVFLSVLRPYEVEGTGAISRLDGPCLLDQALAAYLEGTLHPEMSGDPMATLPPDATVPLGLRFSLPVEDGGGTGEAPALVPQTASAAASGAAAGTGGVEGRVGAAPAGESFPRLSAPNLQPVPSSPVSDETVVREPVVVPEIRKTLFGDEEADAPQPPFRRPRKRR